MLRSFHHFEIERKVYQVRTSLYCSAAEQLVWAAALTVSSIAQSNVQFHPETVMKLSQKIKPELSEGPDG